MQLLLFNYSMNRSSQVFSHQRMIVERLTLHFSQIDVVTAEPLTDVDQGNFRVFSTNWIQGRHIRNVLRFYIVVLPLLFKHRRGILFSHMTEVQSLLIGFLCKLFLIKHVLWYAHKSNSIPLKITFPWVDALVTSTPGSCPVKGRKVFPIGQAVDGNIAMSVSRLAEIPPKSWYHVGRIDPSKNIETLIEVLEPYSRIYADLELHFYGKNSSEKGKAYYEALVRKIRDSEQSRWVHFHGHLDHQDLVTKSETHDAFIHAFWGSLDKSIVEATLIKRIVVSANPEFLSEFKTTKIENNEIRFYLEEQLEELYNSNQFEVNENIDHNFLISSARHTLDNWTERLVSILKNSSL